MHLQVYMGILPDDLVMFLCRYGRQHYSNNQVSNCGILCFHLCCNCDSPYSKTVPHKIYIWTPNFLKCFLDEIGGFCFVNGIPSVNLKNAWTCLLAIYASIGHSPSLSCWFICKLLSLAGPFLIVLDRIAESKMWLGCLWPHHTSQIG